ncbi:transglutaminase superfamily protein [Diaminobutyricimonas aerilata]|uniref:Transglutaminase superfamily protein n=1 Tax=Diaminobutyricimonas aerilata TaxID=1162967 RepID=A0A2M9CIJ2_9MICO|nr:DUF3488 and transglutaminase-like domain-containing protein [Diaminobutyricimonas aerilata]PJJ71708.1 transglutaminase superfamily protein [Diaminobutyricimonas aerilata]
MADRRHADPSRARWGRAGLILALLAASAASLHVLLEGASWWVATITVMFLVLLAASVTRTFARGRAWPTVAAALTLPATLALLFAPGTALLGIVPLGGTWTAWGDLLIAGEMSILRQGIPAQPVPGIVFILALAGGALAVLADLLVQTLRAPALAAIPALVLFAVPVVVAPSRSDAFWFLVAAAVYLVLLRPRGDGTGRRTALGAGAVVLTGAVVVPVLLPDVTSAPDPATGSGAQIGVNPILDLGDDLRRGTEVRAFSYETDAAEGLYFKLTTLDDFTGDRWEPIDARERPENTLDDIGDPAGLTPAVARDPVSTAVDIGPLIGRWLPAPYPPTSIEGLSGSWFWEPEALSVRTDTANVRGQDYTVESLSVRPTTEQLEQAPDAVQPGMLDMVALPEGMPEVIAATAREATGAATNDYQRALALQSYFRGGEFEYSEDAPVEEGYDGTGAEVIATFLDERAGYCVHFASAMAVMARTLDIPSRVAVGFQPGLPEFDDEGELEEFVVTTHDLHAWPELFFEGVGWVRFEPTPGRGELPEYEAATADDPATPDIDESQPSAAPTPSPSLSAPQRPDEAPVTGVADSAVDLRPLGIGAAIAAGVIALLLVPAILRLVVRLRRRRSVRDGAPDAALAAWAEVTDTVIDTGGQAPSTETPRVFAARIGERWVDRGWTDDEPSTGAADRTAARAALDRLVDAVERASFAAGGTARVDFADVERVRRGLRSALDRRGRLAATFAPRSLLRRWNP